MLDLYEELRRLIAALDEHKIEYALCGGLAMAIFDRPRATVDIDLLIEAESLVELIDLAKTLSAIARDAERRAVR